MRHIDRRFRGPRLWSNREIAALGPLFSGSAVNVSGWDDRDKEGGRYRDYFSGIERYAITNYVGFRGARNEDGSIPLDLEAPLPEDLRGQFDLVFNHTTLEHVFDCFTAVKNLCALSRDAVLVVAPFAQMVHSTESFGDFWRFSPEALGKLFEREGFTMVYASANPEKDSAIYVTALAVRDPARWAGRLPKPHSPKPLGAWIGGPSLMFRVLRKLGFADSGSAEH